MDLKLSGKAINGEVRIITSKAVLQRQLICAALCRESTVIEGVSLSEDISAVIGCLEAVGAEFEHKSSELKVIPIKRKKKNITTLDCRESGAALRFMLPVIAAWGQPACIIGSESLVNRPIAPLLDVLSANGCRIEGERLPLKLQGRLEAKSLAIRGDISSQYISGLLLAMPLLGTDCHLYVSGGLQSSSYVELTLAVMRQFGIEVSRIGFEHFYIQAGSCYHSPKQIRTEGDWSNAAFGLAAAAISQSLGFTVSGLNINSKQGDRHIIKLLADCGAKLECGLDYVKLSAVDELKPFSLNAAEYPDLVPIAAVLAAACNGKSIIYNTKRLQYKESDRLHTTCALINSLGGSTELEGETLIINGIGGLLGGRVMSYNDHRIAMSAAVAALICRDSVIIEDAESVNKSYPDFFEEMAKRGMKICSAMAEN